MVGSLVFAEEDMPGYEVRKRKTARRPLLPTKAEIDEHYPLHFNYRAWCKHCVAGKPYLTSMCKVKKKGLDWELL